MTTKNSVFRKVILETIQKQNSESVPIDYFYKEAEKLIAFDLEDRRSTVLKGKATGEESWRRNLRNCLQTLKTNGELVNSSPGFWRMPSNNNKFNINRESSWDKIRSAAEKALELNTSWASPILHNDYRVHDIEGETITILRHSTNTTQILSKSDVMRAITSINAAGGIVGRKAMLNVVAKETAVVFLHPDLSWNSSNQYIKAINYNSDDIEVVVSRLSEATNDHIKKLQNVARRIRKGQVKLRKNLLTVYSSQCCISRTGPENVLQAAHIEAHSVSGNNESTNALLLRSDIHDLFDDGLILIEPYSLKVKVHPILSATDYYQYHDKFLVDRKDSLKPNLEKLIERWAKYNWE